VIDEDYILLCKQEMEAISDASMVLLREQLDSKDTPWSEERINQRRAELYRQHLDPLGIAIVRIKTDG